MDRPVPLSTVKRRIACQTYLQRMHCIREMAHNIFPPPKGCSTNNPVSPPRGLSFPNPYQLVATRLDSHFPYNVCVRAHTCLKVTTGTSPMGLLYPDTLNVKCLNVPQQTRRLALMLQPLLALNEI
jgi:hypothetical protein